MVARAAARAESCDMKRILPLRGRVVSRQAIFPYGGRNSHPSIRRRTPRSGARLVPLSFLWVGGRVHRAGSLHVSLDSPVPLTTFGYRVNDDVGHTVEKNTMYGNRFLEGETY
jgi:hypothetical protein